MDFGAVFCHSLFGGCEICRAFVQSQWYQQTDTINMSIHLDPTYAR